jgi:hypothetical protein
MCTDSLLIWHGQHAGLWHILRVRIDPRETQETPGSCFSPIFLSLSFCPYDCLPLAFCLYPLLESQGVRPPDGVVPPWPSLLSPRLPGTVTATTDPNGLHSNPPSSRGCSHGLPVLRVQGGAVSEWPESAGPGCHLQVRPLLCPLYREQRQVDGGEPPPTESAVGKGWLSCWGMAPTGSRQPRVRCLEVGRMWGVGEILRELLLLKLNLF